ncbi:unnamed protein product, partial [Ascophyllum nodosum]
TIQLPPRVCALASLLCPKRASARISDQSTSPAGNLSLLCRARRKRQPVRHHLPAPRSPPRRLRRHTGNSRRFRRHFRRHFRQRPRVGSGRRYGGVLLDWSSSGG